MADAKPEIEIIGWHDGITEALLRIDDQRWMYASMIAWSPEVKLRIFGLVEADRGTVAKIRALSGGSGSNVRAREDAWSSLRDLVAACLRQVAGHGELRLCDELDGETKATLQVDARELVALFGREIDDALDSSRFSELLARVRTRG